ncbi:MAG: PAS domain S-box protein [Thermodesulfobacteriota bacterium]
MSAMRPIGGMRIALSLTAKILIQVAAVMALLESAALWLGVANGAGISLGYVGYGLCSLVIALACLYAALRRTVRNSVRQIRNGIRQIAVEHTPPQIPLSAADEFGELASDVVSMGREFTAQHLELKKQHEIYQNLFESAPCMITVQDKDYKLTRYNRYFADHFLVHEGARCYEAYKNQTWKCDPCPTEKTFEDGRSHSSEETGFYKDGSRAHWIVSTSPLVDSTGNIVAAMSISLDITARKKLEEELKKSERKYVEIFNHIPYALFLLDSTSLKILECNRSATLLYGYTKGELIEKDFLHLFAEPSTGDYRQTVRTTKVIQRIRHVKKGGRPFYVSMCMSRPEYRIGEKVVLATVVDITERMESEQQLIQANKMATLGEMATGVAHELNQPLSVMKMASGLFFRSVEAGRIPDLEILKTVAGKLQSNLDRASKIIDHMREFGRRSTPSAQTIQLNEVIVSSLDFFSQQLKLRDIEVVLQLESDLPQVRADPNRLEQVFVNLLTNARDAIEEKHGRAAGGTQVMRITLKTHSRRRVVVAEVHDTGCGIPDAIGPKIFEPFFTTKQVGKGTGLGLSICYGIVTDYGGTIQAVTGKENGAVIRIQFPRVDGGNPLGHRPQS